MKKIKLIFIVVAVVALCLVAISYHKMIMYVSEPDYTYETSNSKVEQIIQYKDKTESYIVWALSDSVANCKAMERFYEEKLVSMYAFAHYFKKKKEGEYKYNMGFTIPKSFYVANFLGQETEPLSEITYNKFSDETKLTLPDTLQMYWNRMDTLTVINDL